MIWKCFFSAQNLNQMSLLQTLKKGNNSIEDYVLKMKSLATFLIAFGQKISDDELILYILGGLRPEFEFMIVNLTSRELVTL